MVIHLLPSDLCGKVVICEKLIGFLFGLLGIGGGHADIKTWLFCVLPAGSDLDVL